MENTILTVVGCIIFGLGSGLMLTGFLLVKNSLKCVGLS